MIPGADPDETDPLTWLEAALAAWVPVGPASDKLQELLLFPLTPPPPPSLKPLSLKL